MGQDGSRARRAQLRAFIIIGAITVLIQNASAYTATITPVGSLVRLRGEVKLNLAGNPTNQSKISADEFKHAVVRGLQRWKEASGNTFNFDYWQGTDSTIYEPNSAYNGLSSVYFTSNSGGKSMLPSNVLGLTQVWYNTDSGDILEADIALNDMAYRFTTNSHDTTGSGSTLPAPNDGRTAFIENVLTHELGHALGLSHTGGLQSTMLFLESPEQAFLGCDEQSGIRALYAGSVGNDRGEIRGNVISDRTGSPIFGAHVLAISRRRGTVVASAMTDKGGSYSLGSLEPGTYFIMAEPFFAGASALPAFYSGISANVCEGAYFGRSLLTGPDANTLQGISVGAGSVIRAPQLAARCGGGGATVQALRSSQDLPSSPVIYSGSNPGGFGFTDKMPYSDSTAYYKVTSISGHLEIRAMGYSLYSPVHPSVTLLDLNGQEVRTRKSEEVYVSQDSGYVNHDSALIVNNLPTGDYIVRVTTQPLNIGYYPGGSKPVDQAPFIVLSGSVNEADPTGRLPYNARCRMEEDFAAYTSPPGSPPRGSAEADKAGAGSSFCGNISILNDDSSKKGGGTHRRPPPSSGGAVAGWFLPWLLMAFIARASKRFKTVGESPRR